jgi:predicted RNA binding protein YcfA (HicA-like mRNA interferase family)
MVEKALVHAKLPSLTPQKVIKLLEKKGFLLDRIKGSHHIYYNPETKERIVVPLHKRDLPKAYTMGQDVVFGVGQYMPGTSVGRRLIAHELTHVVQQSGKNRT